MLSAGEVAEALVQTGSIAAIPHHVMAQVVRSELGALTHLAGEVAPGNEKFLLGHTTKAEAERLLLVLKDNPAGLRTALGSLPPAARQNFTDIARQLHAIYRNPTLTAEARQALTGFLVGGRSLSIMEIFQALHEHPEVKASLPAAVPAAGAATYLGLSTVGLLAIGATSVASVAVVGGLAYANHRLDQEQAKAARAQVVNPPAIWQFGPWKL